MQAGLFDLHSGKVLQQVPLIDTLPGKHQRHQWAATSSSNTLASQAPKASVGRLAQCGDCCWDDSGKVLYAQGLLQRGVGLGQQGLEGTTAPAASATLAAVDFGSWHGRHQRWCGGQENSDTGGRSQADAAGVGFSGEHTGRDAGRGDGVSQDPAGSSGGDSERSSSDLRLQQRGRLCQGGQVLHRELHWSAAPTVLAAAGDGGQMLVGTISGDLLWLG